MANDLKHNSEKPCKNCGSNYETENEGLENNCVCGNNENFKFEEGKKYYFNSEGKLVDELDSSSETECYASVDFCTKVQIPDGFKLGSQIQMCFNFSNLSCIKLPNIKTVELPSCDPSKPLQCDVVEGYEVRLIGILNAIFDLAVAPINGFCYFNTPSFVNSVINVPVNEHVAYTCSPKPCPGNPLCVGLYSSYISLIGRRDECGKEYYLVQGNITFKYLGTCS